MAQDEAMMFPNERIKTWLANNRAQKSEERIDPPPPEDTTLELEAMESLDPEHA